MDAVEERVRPPSVVRAWLVAHEARSVGTAMVVLTVILCAGAQWLLPVPGEARKVPFWQLTPALLAMVASLATMNRLPTAIAGPQRVARGGWACCVIAAAAACSWVIGLGTANLPSLVPGTAVVVALTFAVSVVTGRMAVWVGVVLALVILARVNTMEASEDLWASLPGTTQSAMLAVATIGLAAYTWVGTRRPGAEDGVGSNWVPRWRLRQKG